MNRLSLKLIGKFSKLLITIVVATCKVRVIGKEKNFDKDSSAIYMTWHRQIFFDLHVFKSSGVHPLISQSRDGEIVAAVADAFGTNPVRGSSSRGGAKALINLIKLIRSHQAKIYITADGPKGPSGIVKEGIISLGEKTGAPIVPITWLSSKEKVFHKTWDNFKIPKPFSRVVFIFGDPIYPDQYRDLNKEGKTDFLQKKIGKIEKEAREFLTSI